MTYPTSSPPALPQAWGFDLPENYGRKDIESLFQNIMQVLSESISARSSQSLLTTPYSTGDTISLPTSTQPILQQYVQWVVPSGGGSTSISLLVNNPILPISIYGAATSSTTSYPLGYNVGSVTLNAYISNNNVNITTTAALAGYTVTVVVRYVNIL